MGWCGSHLAFTDDDVEEEEELRTALQWAGRLGGWPRVVLFAEEAFCMVALVVEEEEEEEEEGAVDADMVG